MKVALNPIVKPTTMPARRAFRERGVSHPSLNPCRILPAATAQTIACGSTLPMPHPAAIQTSQ